MVLKSVNLRTPSLSITDLEVASLRHEVGLDIPMGLPHPCFLWHYQVSAWDPAFVLITEQEASWLRERLLSFGAFPILLPPHSRDRQLGHLLPVCFSQPQHSWVLYPYGALVRVPRGLLHLTVIWTRARGIWDFLFPALQGLMFFGPFCSTHSEP